MHREIVNLERRPPRRVVLPALPSECPGFRTRAQAVDQAVGVNAKLWPEQGLRIGEDGRGRIDAAGDKQGRHQLRRNDAQNTEPR